MMRRSAGVRRTLSVCAIESRWLPGLGTSWRLPGTPRRLPDAFLAPSRHLQAPFCGVLAEPCEAVFLNQPACLERAARLAAAALLGQPCCLLASARPGQLLPRSSPRQFLSLTLSDARQVGGAP